MLQVEARMEFVGMGDKGRIEKPVYHVVAHNGDDNVTGRGNTLGAAAAQCIHYMLNGSVYPLTGNGGRFDVSAWEHDMEVARELGRADVLAEADKPLTMEEARAKMQEIGQQERWTGLPYRDWDEVKYRLEQMGFNTDKSATVPQRALNIAIEAVRIQAKKCGEKAE
jgi:hypothetical protein